MVNFNWVNFTSFTKSALVLLFLKSVLEFVVTARLITWMSPHALLDMAHAIHVECVEQDFFRGAHAVYAACGFSGFAARC